mmetsp:Transcript_43619/g.132016  ORF Transcript_43619/g.132016 Transcript_43619/m.132016 type:complete len:232 (-) Transcript_43619:398-1093(-)
MCKFSAKARPNEATMPTFCISFLQASAQLYPPDKAATLIVFGCSTKGRYMFGLVGIVSCRMTDWAPEAFPRAANSMSSNNCSHAVLSGESMSTSGCRIGTRPWSRTRLAKSICWSTSLWIPIASGNRMTERTLAPKKPSDTAILRSSSSSRALPASRTPSASGASPPLMVKKGTADTFVQRYIGNFIPSTQTCMLSSDTMDPMIFDCANAALLTRRVCMSIRRRIISTFVP